MVVLILLLRYATYLLKQIIESKYIINPIKDKVQLEIEALKLLQVNTLLLLMLTMQ